MRACQAKTIIIYLACAELCRSTLHEVDGPDNLEVGLARSYRPSNAGLHVSEHERLPVRQPHRQLEKGLFLHTSHHIGATLLLRGEQRGTFAHRPLLPDLQGKVRAFEEQPTHVP